MSSKIINSIPKACRENWLELDSDEKVKFCNLCQKNIFDSDVRENEDVECLRYSNSQQNITTKKGFITNLSNLFTTKKES